MKQITIFLIFVSATLALAEELTCEKPRCDSATVLYPVKDEPQQYYKCIAQSWAVIRTCHDDLYFDYDSQDCVEEEDYTNVCDDEPTEIPTTTEEPAETVSCRRPLCLSVTEKRYPVRDEPKNYWECESLFVPKKKSCPVFRYFDYNTQDCVRRSQWQDVCEPEPETTTEMETTTVTEEPTTVEPVSCEKPRCIVVTDKLFPVKDEPSNYYECVGRFKAEKKSCRTLLYFDYYSQKCVRKSEHTNVCDFEEPEPTTTEEPTTTTEEPSTTVDVPTCREPLCLSVTDKLFPVKDEPTNFYVCVGRFKHEKRSCAVLRYFDYNSQKCVRKSEHTNVCDFEEPETTTTEEPTTTEVPSTTVDVPTCREPTCLTVTDKLFPVKDEPTSYYVCVGRFKHEKRSCAVLRYFDYYSQACVRKSEHTNVCDFEEPSTTTTEEPETTTTEEPTTTEVPSTTVDVPTCREPTCLTVTDKLFPVKDEPTSYYVCVGRFKHEKRSCAVLRYFDYYSQACVRKSEHTNVCDFEEPSTTTTEEPETTTTEEPTTTEVPSTTVDVPTCREPTCLTVTDKLFPVKDEPTNFYVCVGRFKHEKRSCAVLRYFDYNSQKCVRKSEHTNVCDFEEPSTTTTEEATSTLSTTTEEPSTTTTEETSTLSTTTEEATSTSTLSTTTEETSSTTADVPTCRAPICSSATDKLFPVLDEPASYYECTGRFKHEKKSCGARRYFDYYSQSCVRVSQWTNVCGEH